METILSVMAQNLVSPIVLSFALGLLAAMARSSLSVPEAAAKALSIYLLFAIGFKGGASVAAHGLEGSLVAALIAGIALSFVIPVIAFGLLRVMTRLSAVDAAAVAGHYGSISIVTFVSATAILASRAIDYEGYMVAVAAAMEAPAIVAALWLAARAGAGARMDRELWREVLLNGSIVLLIGAFVIGAVTGERGLKEIESFIVSPFKGVLCLFLLDMGLVAGRGLRQARSVLSPGAFAFAVLMPLAGAALALPVAIMLDLSTGGAALLMVLSASASYIAVPAAMRVALPEANPSIYLTLSLGVTFPFNLALGIPIYVALAEFLLGA
ncbi:sodium-dependent bicarbonate transport family permease [Defluviimonas sp. WL0002]|uniref:Sodium-dependent bicarbonate transport family permease n=1 Tax=Albidovulum marisflavi TaxID=2984159 RepID=A0ABT2Z939_9RHOB|nr:sodium-dependent bicarbonate transport family permease [Defluviimonas sp. WL0002]MCV2867621.1 sodium-dependent bicarbonate transport family permease [Defluviimonas sp. WL0002]